MRSFKNLTVTEGRLKEAIKTSVSQAVMSKVDSSVEKAVEDERIRTGVITRFYPYLDKAEVKLDYNKKTILCKILHRFGGDMIDFYTPLEYEESFDEELKEPCVIPRAKHNVCVLQIHDDDSEENLILGYYQNTDVVGFKPASAGNIKLMSITEPNLYWIEFGNNGLNLRLPKNPSIEVGMMKDEMENGDFYTKKEVDDKLADEGLTVKSLLMASEDYKQTSEGHMYSLFRGDCWTINNNFESSASITSRDNLRVDNEYPPGHVDNFKVVGTFRTQNDMVGLYWNSKDPIDHPYISYGNRDNYRDVVLEFDYSMSGCKNFSDGVVSITIRKNDGSTYYFTMGRYITNNNHLRLDFNNLTLLPGNQYIDSRGQTITVNEETRVEPIDIKNVMFVIVPDVPNYTSSPPYTIMENVDFVCEVTNIKVTNSEICLEHIPLDPHKYRLCEGYDDFYDFNPKRITREMRKLGYTEWCDLYIGASHFYEKSGVVGDIITDMGFNHNRTEKMVLNKNVPLNKAFRAWLDCYSRELKENDCPNLVVSVSMENLQCPHDWRQKQYAPSQDAEARRKNPEGYAMTGWVPSTFFYSPCHEEILPYMKSVSEACLDIVVGNNMKPILQLGEAWWWWNEYMDPVYRSPCFYDEKTKEKYRSEFGVDMPVYITPDEDYDNATMDWLNHQIYIYSSGLRDVVKSDKYNNGLYMALFFPPSVLDPDRVPPMIRRVNYLTDIYSPEHLDVLQLEDYDWVTGSPLQHETKERDRLNHLKVYSIGQDLGFPVDRIHYFGGFVQYPSDAIEFWREIQKAMDVGFTVGFAEVYVWAGSQVRRDKKMIGYESMELIQNLLED